MKRMRALGLGYAALALILPGCLGDVVDELERAAEEAAATETPQETQETGPWSELPPQVYFVIHADPATGPELRWRWDNLVSFMNT